MIVIGLKKVITDILGKLEFSVDFENRSIGNNTWLKNLVQVWNPINSIFMKHKFKNNKNTKRNLSTKLHLLQNDQVADTTLLHSHDKMYL